MNDPKMNNRCQPNRVNFIWAILIISLLQGIPVSAEPPIVHAVLFYSPTCPHCHKVIDEDIPPLLKKYGEQLNIVTVNVRQAGGQALYQAAIKQFNITKDRLGVPTLIVGNHVLVGADEIPMMFPELIESLLAQGGIDWPHISGLLLHIVKTPLTEPDDGRTMQSSSPLQSSPSEALSISEKLARDPLGNGLAILVLISMILVVLHTLLRFKHNLNNQQTLEPDWFVPLLSLLGLAISSYMVYVDTAQVAAICGPIGDCNTVQQSEYAHLFGIIPIAVLGVISYIVMLLAWSIGHYGSGKLAYLGHLGLFILALLGTLFSIYLTFLEPFVIGATCAWCIATAIIMTVLLWRTRVVK